MSDGIPTRPDLPVVRVPLRPLSEGERVARLFAQGLDEDELPLSLTDEERAAALNPGLPDPRSRTMDVKPGWKTSEFWLHAAMVLVILPVLAWLGNSAISPLGDMLTSLGAASPLLALAVPLVKGSLFAFLAWCGQKLAVAYGDNRTELKTAAPAAVAPVAPAA